MDRWGHDNLQNWQGCLALVMSGTSQPCNVLYIGDSWTIGDTITGPLTAYLFGHFGYAGPGYGGFYNTNGLSNYLGYSRTGTWTIHDTNSATTTPNQILDINGFAISSTDTTTPATANSSVNTIFGASATNAVLYYYQQPGGGSFSYVVTVNGVSSTPVVVNTSGTAGLTTVAISGIPIAYGPPSQSITATVTSAATAGVTLFGVDWQNSTSGVRLSVLGHTGETAQGLVNILPSLWTAEVAALSPSLVVLQMGQNDSNVPFTTAGFIANIQTLVSQIKAASPLSDVLLVGTPDNGEGTQAILQGYDVAERSLALSSSLGFFDIYPNFGPYAGAAGSFARGIMASNHHPTNAGGAQIAHLEIGYLAENWSVGTPVISANNATPIIGNLSITAPYNSNTNVSVTLNATGSGTTETDSIQFQHVGNPGGHIVSKRLGVYGPGYTQNSSLAFYTASSGVDTLGMTLDNNGNLSIIGGLNLGGAFSVSSALPNSAGVYGITTSSSSYGVWGDSSVGGGVKGSSSAQHGVYGISTSSNYAGIFGTSATNGGFGVKGVATGSATNGVYGSSSNNSGVYGVSTAGNYAGVQGSSAASGGYGVKGDSTSGFGGSFSTLKLGAIAFANLATWATAGAELMCSDCDAPATVGATCTSAGAKAGAVALYIRGGWVCF